MSPSKAWRIAGGRDAPTEAVYHSEKIHCIFPPCVVLIPRDVTVMLRRTLAKDAGGTGGRHA